MEFSAKTKLPLHSIGIIYPSPSLRTALHFGIIFTLITSTIGEKVKRALKTPFLAINAKGGESISPKQKDRTPAPPCHCQKNSKFLIFSIGIFQIIIPLRNSISIGIYILKEEFFQKIGI
jgi:hypothetical protein